MLFLFRLLLFFIQPAFFIRADAFLYKNHIFVRNHTEKVSI